MRKLSLPLLITASLLCGCQTTPQEARLKGAAFSQTSNRSVEQVSECIYHGWSDTEVIEKDPSTHIEHGNERLTVYAWQDSMFTDLYRRGKGSEVRFYKTFTMGPEVLADRSGIVKRCA